MKKEKLSEELEKYGYVFSRKKSLMMYAGAVAVMFAMGSLFRLNAPCRLVLCVSGIAIFPFFLRNLYKNRYHQRQFSDLNIYMEQFLYSFRKTGKVLETLEDLRQIFDSGPMRRKIDEAREHILHTFDELNVEENALHIIEDAYPYDGLRTIHRFAVSSEVLGGDYSQSILLLLEARRMFADRSYALQQEQKKRRMDVFLSIATSLLLCSMIFALSARIGVDVSSNPITQIVTTIVLILDMIIFYQADKKLTVGFVQSDHKDDTRFIKTYERISHYREDRFFDRLGKRVAIRSLTREIEKQFPNWLMEVSLLLQSENVAVAISRSLEYSPAVLKPPLEKLVLDLKQYPNSIEPYLGFLSDFSIPEISSAMKMLYSVSAGTGGDAAMQIADMIRRNQLLYDKAKRLENEDALAGMYALFLAPQLTGSLKLVVDMVLLLIVYLSDMS